MRNIYHAMQKYVIKPLLYVGITTSLLIGGCRKGPNPRQQEPENGELRLEDLTTGQEITNPHKLGHFRVIYLGHISTLGTGEEDKGKMRLDDIDKDGDLDLTVIDPNGHMFIYENLGNIIPERKTNAPSVSDGFI